MTTKPFNRRKASAMNSWSYSFTIKRFALLFALLLPKYDLMMTEGKKENDLSSSFPKYMEPEVFRYQNVFPREVCEQLIELGEKAGFPLEFDSIDAGGNDVTANNISQAIDVINEDGTVNHPEMYDLMAPYLPKLAEIIREQRSTKLYNKIYADDPNFDPNYEPLPELGWVFFRKYSPASERNSLRTHFDFNLHSVIVALNDDYEGGGIFYIKPEYEKNPDWMKPGFEDNLHKGHVKQGIPILSDHQQSYDWINTRNRVNTSDVIFPLLQQGDIIVHNYTVYHGVAPIEKGTRYSMALFFDMDNPLIDGPSLGENTQDKYDGDGDDYEGDEGMVEITMKHDVKECNPSNGQLEYLEDGIDIIWVSPEQLEIEKHDEKKDNIMLMEKAFEDELAILVAEELSPGTSNNALAHPDMVFRAVRPFFRDEDNTPNKNDENARATPEDYWEVLAEIKIAEGKTQYAFVSPLTQEDCAAAFQAAAAAARDETVSDSDNDNDSKNVQGEL